MTDTFSMPLIIRALGRGKKGTRNLTEAEAGFVMSAILDGSITPAQLGAFLMLMRVKEETAEELSGMVSAAEQHIQAPECSVDVNWPAYAGKKKQPSWYMLAAKLLAENGIKILMHGGGEHTEGRQYAANICSALNIPSVSTLSEAAEAIGKHSIAYIPLNSFSPVLSGLIDMKAELGLRSPVNTLVRHLNPFKAKTTLQGMFHPAYMPLHHDTAVQLNQNNNIVLKGDGGEFEVRPDSETAVSINAENLSEMSVVPPVLAARAIRPETVSLEPLMDLWNGKTANEYGEQAVIQTAALVLAVHQHTSPEAAHTLALQWWTNRKPLQA
ncbi:glycosyl transferase family protein [Reinekea marinisedimentorum]|uniref:Anthranilate phosphoribosyltransferase n=1 Tax=Reinekea marinisedimentorum TaxID=230495 RepID=A0A4R3IB57_9GAMM|nr:glycosyl transferase family protein [Reinekea marinisedimentorum]TCS42491.1 anthranilate phosphoribosyltransferase [Reinekea marinisedimentorum]